MFAIPNANMDLIIKQRCALEFSVRLIKSATENYDLIKTAYRVKPLYIACVGLASKFKNGHISVEDEPCPGRQTKSNTEANLILFLFYDSNFSFVFRRSPFHDITLVRLLYQWVVKVLTDNLFHPSCRRCVTSLLSYFKWCTCFTIFSKLLILYLDNLSNYLSVFNIINIHKWRMSHKIAKKSI